MESALTEPEVDAALLLIQLSGGSEESGGDAAKTVEQSREAESGGDSNEISSVGMLFIMTKELPHRRKKRFRSIVDLYGVTKQIIENQDKNSNDFK